MKKYSNIIRIVIFLMMLYAFDFVILANIIALSLLLSETIIKMLELALESEKR